MDKWTVLVILFLSMSYSSSEEADDEKQMATFKIEGKVSVPGVKPADWVPLAKVLVDGGQFVGFVRSDGTFEVHDIPTGSYVVEIAHPKYMFEATRIDISARGKIRARRVNNVDSKSVIQVTYPLRLRSKGLAGYFQKREEFRIVDVLKNPMVLMMVLPVVFIVILPKLVNTQDPELQKEMQNMNLMNQKQDLPDLSEMATSFFGGGSSAQKKSKDKAIKAKRK
ncbi:ER membrane protein complex subunit 7-like [Lytechinus variegatus]|uniref:ER membrane protein complex subunit 7-like n=1 Tax=Lytechinus variegatus TaxID=7654 RepID=UPI001BB201CD|nr:ER membrane protein complex subunit 7-like [Lytechinus variegatus]